MHRFWQERDPALYAKTRSEVESQYPTLRFESRNRIIFCSGSFPVGDAKSVIDRFLIEIELPPNFPRQLPIVKEVGRRIPIIADRHMRLDGSACLFVEEDWWLSHPDGYSLLEFLDGPVRAFFVGQSMFDLGMEWPFGERSHGIEGILECYAELTGAPNLVVAEDYLRLLAQEKFKGHHECPCGSGKKLRQCHQQMLLALRSRIPWKVSQRSCQHIQNVRRTLGN
jgi:hypothetical protein